MSGFEDYWARIKRIPLYPDAALPSGEAVICKNHDGTIPVRVTKPELFRSDAEREAALQLLEHLYKPTRQ